MAEIDVTIVLAVKNEEKYIESAVESILAQEGLRIEVIVVDDNSSDRTFALAQPIAARDSRLRLLRNPKSGKNTAWNLGVAEAQGRFTCLFCGDDIMPAGSLRARFDKVRGFADDRPVVGLCKILTFSEDPRFNGTVVPRKPGRGALSGVSPLMNRPAVSRIFPVPEQFPNEDTWMELAITYFPGWTVLHSDTIGCEWRVHDGNSINMMVGFPDYNRKITARIAAVPLFYERFGSELEEPSRVALRARIACEQARLRGDLLGILGSPVSLVDKLRSLSIANAFLFGIRRRLYGVLSGW